MNDSKMKFKYNCARILRSFTVAELLINFLRILIIFSLLMSLISFLFVGDRKALFGWLVLYIPFVWFIWMICAIIFGNRQRVFKLIFLWFLIDVSALLLFLSFSMGMAHWERANGADVVVYITFFPVIFPANRLAYLTPKELIDVFIAVREFLVGLFPSAIRGIVSVWLSISLLAAFQCIVFVSSSMLVKILFFKNKKQNTRSNL